MYYLYKLKFPNGVHFGSENVGIGLERANIGCLCDTFFSALLIEILNLFGKDKLEEFVEMAKKGEILLSDLHPFIDEELYIPKPIISYEKDTKLVVDNEKNNIKKKLKKIHYIPITKFSDYIQFLRKEVDLPEFNNNFGDFSLVEKVKISRTESIDDNELYSVSVFNFEKNSGLYFVVKLPENYHNFFEQVLQGLSLSGIGGKRSSGYGQFEIAEDYIELDEECFVAESDRILAKLINSSGDYYLTLSTTYPKKDEIEKVQTGFYSLIKRQGFVYSKTYSDTLSKKVSTTMIKAGSCFKDKLAGEICDVSNNGKHPVYRYGKPIMLGFNL